MGKNKKDKAKGFLVLARDFRDASERVFDPLNNRNRPLLYLYFHTLELAFKAFLLSHSVTSITGHNLAGLYAECCKHGLAVKPSCEPDNVIRLLTSANDEQGLRYFSNKAKGHPEISWTREVVYEVYQTVESHIGPHIPGPAARLQITFGKPQKKKQ